ncbi:hypothetical protein VP01_7450g1, partial [Puccinia sorghi]
LNTHWRRTLSYLLRRFFFPQRAARQGRHSQSNLFKNCVEFVDKTIIPRALVLRKNKEEYWMHKILYGMNSMIFCDHKLRIIYIALHGWCGSAHDSCVMRASHLTYITFQLINLHKEYFEPEKYLLADSGYACHPVIVPAFKKPCGGYLDRPHHKLNYLLSLQQVLVERKIGALKRRWTTLTNLPLVISNKNSTCIDMDTCVLYVAQLPSGQSIQGFVVLGQAGTGIRRGMWY